MHILREFDSLPSRGIMSSESDEEPIVFHQNVKDEELESSGRESSSSDDVELLADLKGRLYTDGKITTSSPIKKPKIVPIQKFDLGRNYDPNLVQSLARIEYANEEIKSDSTITTLQEKRKISVSSRIKPIDVSSQYIDLITREMISGRYIDWHFIGNDTKFEEIDYGYLDFEDILHLKYPTLLDLFKSLGAEVNLLGDDKPLTNKRDYDSLCEITPVDTMMRAIECYQNDKDFTKLLLCFILDRKVWECQDCDANWCSRMLGSMDDKRIIDSYLSLTDSKDYFMHYRLSRCLPQLNSSMIHRIITDRRTIENEFTQLISSKNYKSLLYFILFVYGSEEVPFGLLSYTKSFRDRVEDMCNEGTNAVELSLLKGILNLFLKIRIY